MKRLLLTTALVSIAALSAHAQGTDATKPTTPPESTIEKSTPDMKAPADSKMHGPTNRVDEAVPPMKSGDSPSTAAAPSTTVAPAGGAITLTEEQAEEWIGKPVYSSDGKNLGEVAELKRDSAGKVNELQADIGGFLGFGETRVSIPTTQFTFDQEKVILSLKESETNSLTRVVQ